MRYIPPSILRGLRLLPLELFAAGMERSLAKLLRHLQSLIGCDQPVALFARRRLGRREFHEMCIPLGGQELQILLAQAYGINIELTIS